MKNKVSLAKKLFQKLMPVITFSFFAQLLLMPSTGWSVDNTNAAIVMPEATITASSPQGVTQVSVAASGQTPQLYPLSDPKAPVAPSATKAAKATKTAPVTKTKSMEKAAHPTKKSGAKAVTKPKAAKKTTKKTTKKKPAKKKAAKKKAPKKKVARSNGHVWGTVSYARPRDYFILSRSKSRVYTGLIGMDYTLTPKVTVGFYYSNGTSRSRSPMTQLVNKSRGRSNTNNFFANATYNFTPSFYFNFAVGYSYTPNKNTNFDRVGTGSTISKTKTNVFSLSPSINGSRTIGSYTASCQFGYSHSNSYRNKARDSNGRILPSSASHSDSASFFADFSYNFKKVSDNIQKIAPFINVGLDHGFQNPKAQQARNRQFYTRSQDGWKAGTGLRFMVFGDVSVNAGWTISRGRTKQNSQLVSLTVRVGAF